MARPSRSSTPERVRLSSACTTFTDLGFSFSRSGTWAGKGPAWQARSTSAEASTFRCPLDSFGPGTGHQCCSRVPRSPGLSLPQPLTFSMINVHSLASYWSTWGSCKKGALVSIGAAGRGQGRERSPCWEVFGGGLHKCWALLSGMLPSFPRPQLSLIFHVMEKGYLLQGDLLGHSC